MSYAKRFLLSEQRYKSLMDHASNTSTAEIKHTFTHPGVKNTIKGQREMKAVANDSNLTDFEKNELFASLIPKFLRDFQGALTVPKKEALLGKVTEHDKKPVPNDTSRAEPLNSTPKKRLSRSYIVSMLPRDAQAKAGQLLTDLYENDKFDWNERGVVKYEGKEIKGSNISNLLIDVFKNQRDTLHSSVTAWNKFKRALEGEDILRLQPSHSPVKAKTSKRRVQSGKGLNTKWIRVK